MPELSGWANFYVIVGTAAGALIGLQFVVMTLIPSMPITGTDAQAGNAFSTPTVVHFGLVLLLSAVGTAPWNAVIAIAVIWGATGLGGILYVVLTARRMRSQKAYRPVFEDRLCHVWLPFVAYTGIVVAGCVACFDLRSALFLVGAAVLLLLFIGIHNAWDIVTYQVFVKRPEQKEADRPK
jgi:hypothetical protein